MMLYIGFFKASLTELNESYIFFGLLQFETIDVDSFGQFI